ncbi:MAG: Hsp20/alpha crystallin family protein [Halobacteriales archaeon SW_9_67_25]|jgi:HSP20 family protein|nr:MAG: Hsp20/alpha crystallin family protein [Halobacteriales archaeon SW_9_67_25]
MRDDDREDPFDEFFEEIERMMNDMMGGNAEFRFERASGGGGDAAADRSAVHYDIHETDETVRVVADVPGVEKSDIDLKCDGTTLSLRAGSDGRDYSERVELPARVDEHSADATYNNGVLEVAFDRADDSTSIDI